MDLCERIKMILQENHLKQKELARELGVTESYISALLSGRNTKVSNSLATLIEERYGYDSSWILSGKGSKMKVAGKNKMLSDIHQRAILQIERLSPEQIKAVLAFVHSLEEVEQILKEQA